MVYARQDERAHSGRAVTFESVNRGLRVLCSRGPRGSILGEGGRAKEVQSEFLVLLQDAISQPDLAKTLQRYQLAVDEAKVRLDLGAAPGAWLIHPLEW